MSYSIENVVDSGDDILVVTATDADGNEVVANGWVSATTNFFAPSAYSTDKAGNVVRDPKAVSRAMTPDEVGAYALSLLPEEVVAVEPTPIAFAVSD